jgi:hypothetical protein
MIDESEDFRDAIDRQFIYEELDNQIATLFDREQMVLCLRFWSKLTLKDAGEIVCVQRERVRQIESKVIRKMRHPSRSKKISIMLSDLTVKEYEERQAAIKKKEELEEKLANEKRQREHKEWILRRKIKRQFPHGPPEFLSLEYTSEGKPYIGCPGNLWFTVPDIIYQEWLSTLIEDYFLGKRSRPSNGSAVAGT